MYHGRFKQRGKGKHKRHIPGSMNATEQRYAEHLDGRQMAGDILHYWFEAVTFKLAADTRFTPDFVVQLTNGEIEIHEVKALTKKNVILKQDDAYVKLKVAADKFPFTFRLIGIPGKTVDIPWKYQEIEPA